MSRLGSTDRLWLAGGGVLAAVLLALGWFVFIGPQLTETSSLQSQTAAAEGRVSALRAGLRDLQQRNNELPKYKAELATDRRALPTTPASSDFLRDMQALGDRTGVAISGITVSQPVAVAGNANVRALPMVLTATGSKAQLNKFLDQLQQAQPRAVLINTANLSPVGAAAGPSSPFILSLNLRAFLEPTG